MKSPNRPFTSPMIPSLISTPVTAFWSKASDESTSRPPPVPTTMTRDDGTEIMHDVRDVVAEVVHISRVAAEPCQLRPGVGVDVEVQLVRPAIRRERRAEPPP